MPEETSSSRKLGTLQYFKTGIPGLRSILCDKEGFAYYHSRGLNIVLFGPAGSGKTIFALQCAMGAIAEGKHVVFLTKDTSPITLLQRLNKTFKCFGLIKSPCPQQSSVSCSPQNVPQEAKNITPTTVLHNVKESEKTINWTESISLIPNDISSCIFTARLDGEETVLKWRVVLLDLLAERMESQKVVVENPKEGQRSIVEVIEAEPVVPIMAFGSLGLLNAGEFDRYAANESIFEGLARLCPRLRPVFEAFSVKTKDVKANAAVWDRWRNDLFVVCDSLPLSVLEDCLRSQTEGPAAAVPQKRPGSSHSATRALTLFAMESAEMPDPMTAAFPPDIQIKLGFREEPYGMKTRTIQVLKARFQEINNEPFPFVIHGQDEEDTVEVQVSAQALNEESPESHCDSQDYGFARKSDEDAFSTSHTVDLFWLAQDGVKETLANPEKDTIPPKDKDKAKYSGKLRYPLFALRKPGITIFPSLPSVVHSTESHAPYEERRHIMFGSRSIDALTTEGRLAGGGTTLVVTENRCNSTVLALHFLLGEIGAACGPHTENRHITGETNTRIVPASRQAGNNSFRRTPNSCLYIALENDLIGVLHNIWRYPLLRAAVFQEKEGCFKDPSKNWERIETSVVSGRHQRNQPGKHHLYRIPLNPSIFNGTPCTVSNEDIYRAHLYASSLEFMGHLRLREMSKCMK